jgi:RNA polymerase sigma-70 factor, ECF subfamily
MGRHDGEVDSSDRRTALEAEVRGHVEAGQLERAATRALEIYGGELYGFLHALARNDDLAAEAFAIFCEDLWKGLPTFRWEASLRTWSYVLARNALERVRRDPHRRAERNLPISQYGTELAAQQRSMTQPHLRSDVKDRFAELRSRLDPDDHALLILRIDRKMSWRDIARATSAGDGGDDDLDRRAAALRKRFERAKATLRELATKSGLLPEE